LATIFSPTPPQRIASHARTDDIVGRIGGDEFLMICRGLAGPVEALAEARRLCRTLTQRVAVTGRSIQMSASIGVTFATPGASVQSVVIRADEAMYRCKRQPGRTPVLLASALDPPPR
jgi:diguanylate cyclase (GGDEF)-like protein